MCCGARCARASDSAASYGTSSPTGHDVGEGAVRIGRSVTSQQMDQMRRYQNMLQRLRPRASGVNLLRTFWLDPNGSATPKGPNYTRAWIWRLRGTRLCPEDAVGGLIDTSEPCAIVSGKAPRPGGGSTTEAWPALLGWSCSLAVSRAQSRAKGSYD